jgi:hypothetical protein
MRKIHRTFGNVTQGGETQGVQRNLGLVGAGLGFGFCG